MILFQKWKLAKDYIVFTNLKKYFDFYTEMLRSLHGLCKAQICTEDRLINQLIHTKAHLTKNDSVITIIGRMYFYVLTELKKIA